MLCTPLCRTLGIRYPIFSAGIGSAAGAELAAAVSNAGGLGVLGTASLPARFVRQQIIRLRELSDRPFGVNVVLPLLRRGTIEACLDEHVPVLVLFWGEAAQLKSIVADAHRQDTRVFVQVGSREEALMAVETGADGIIAQGWEAGGHVRGTTALVVLVPAVADAIAPVPVVAAGGVADGRALLAALCLGAQAVSMGTRFLASEEANADAGYKQRVVSAIAEHTVHTEMFDRGFERASHRVLRNESVRAWEAAGRPDPGARPQEGEILGTMSSGGTTVSIPAYSAYVPEPGVTASLDGMALYAGQSCSLVNDIKPAAQIVSDAMRDAQATLGHLQVSARGGEGKEERKHG
jgi:NAD(P)H-dependent flavin oxidoreductase YrpB (nitropropane dioxygenase family)